MNNSSQKNFFIGLSLANTSNADSSICVLDRNSKIILIDKFYFAQDIEYFFETSPYILNSALCASVAYDNKLLDGKWRIHSKNYKPLGDYFKVNRNDWTNRISKRCSDLFLKLKNRNVEVIRADIRQLRQAYGICPHYQIGTSLDCKNLQLSLKIKFGFNQMPENMLSSSSLEAIICAMFIKDYMLNKTSANEIYQIESIPVLSKNFSC